MIDWLEDLNVWAWILIATAFIVAIVIFWNLLIGFGVLWALNVFGFKIPISLETVGAAAILIVVLIWIFKR